MVNLHGERFMNEDCIFNTTFAGNLFARQPGRFAYSIFDQALLKKYKKNGPDDPNAEPPPEDHFLWRWWELFDAGRESPDEEFRHRQLEAILDEWAELVPVVGLIGVIPGPLVCKNGVRNVPDSAYYADRTKDESLHGPAVIYWENPEASS